MIPEGVRLSIASKESSISNVWDELKFESIKFITSGMDKKNRKRTQCIKIGKLQVRNMANRGGAAAPNWRQGQEQPQHQDAAGQ